MNIGLLGMGTIGTGAYEQINKGKGNFSDSTKIPAKITKILDKDPNKRADDAIITNNPSDIMDDESIEIVVALMGGSDFEYEQIKKALENKKHVVTANKAVIGAHLEELSKLAKENNVMLRYEASVGGGIPIIKALEDQLKNNDITEISGILNGTTNFILTKMQRDRADFDNTLKEAQAIGFAEADPSADLYGHDVARKLAILSSLAYKTIINDDDIIKRGIENVKPKDITETHRMGYVIKHLGQSINDNGSVSIVVEPVLFKKYSTEGSVSNEFNIVNLKGNVIGDLHFYGKGAGKDATANAITNDVLDVIEAIDNNILIEQPVINEEVELKNNEAFKGEYYIRVNLKNSQGLNLTDVIDRVEDITDIKHINTSDDTVYIFTREVKSKKIDKLIEDMELLPDEYFYARIID